jgi:glycosyltransferase involved in cell wall biosynthesis
MSYWLDPGGSERQLTEVAKALDQSRYVPYVGSIRTYGRCVEELRAAGVPLVEFPIRGFFRPSHFRAARQLGRYIREHRIDIVHTFDVPATLFAVPVARLYGAPNVLSSQRAYRSLTPGKHPFLKLMDRMVDGVVVNSRAVGETLIKEDKINPELVHLCHNGLDLSVFFPPSERSNGPVRIGVAAVLRPEKGLLTLVDAFSEVQKAGLPVHLTILGSGPMLEPLQMRVHEHGIAESCAFEPATGAVAARLRTFDIFVLPSLSEALSNALMEAMACGCCAIASRVGGNPELIEEDVSGLLFEAGDAPGLARKLEVLIRDAELRKRLGDAGARRMREHFSMSASVRRMQEIYDGLSS